MSMMTTLGERYHEYVWRAAQQARRDAGRGKNIALAAIDAAAFFGVFYGDVLVALT